MKNRKTMIVLITIILLLVMVIAGSSYARWSVTKVQKSSNNISSSCFELQFNDENSTSINLTNTYPMPEEDAMKQTPYEFTITNTCSTDMFYNITLNTTGTTDLDNVLDYKLIDENNNVIGPKIIGSLRTYDSYNNTTYEGYSILNSYILTSGHLTKATMNNDNTAVVTPGESKTYRLYIWMDENVTDTSTMNKSFNGKIIVTSSTSDTSLDTEGMIVTFDPNGGTVDTQSKTVMYGNNYGDLPTPTREGYTFKGWNGKNLFDYEDILKNNSDTVTQLELNGKQTISWVNSRKAEENLNFLHNPLKDNTQYTLSGKVASDVLNKAWISIAYDDGSFNHSQNGRLDDYILQINSFYDISYTTKANATVILIGGIWHNSERMYIDINSFQIEEGTEATEYEPYYVTSNTKVVRHENHTLKAIWEEN
ncbi:MAG: hypothetical protein E7158_06530 [Firmicutes bacterium]|nr:hypothetical protein [Bacillota bacterium]